MRFLRFLRRFNENELCRCIVFYIHQTQKTEVIRKSLNPQWNSEWFRFEVDDEELQDEPLQVRGRIQSTATVGRYLTLLTCISS